MTTNSLIDKLRRRIKDDRPNTKALSLSVVDETIDRAIAEVTNGHLTVRVLGGNTKSADFRLDDPRYATIGRLHNALSRMDGYTSSLDEDAQADHMSLDIASVAPIDIGKGRSSINLTHHLFSDSELEEVVESSIQRHNPRFTGITLPESEEAFVLMLAHADICRRQAYDTSKRRGLDTEVGDLVRLADSIEESYRKDVERLTRALVSPAEPVPSTMGPGDVVVGTTFRSSLRTGRKSPFAAQPGPTAPVFVEPDAEDVEDESVRIHWARSGDNDFHHFELWMDTSPDVRPGIEDRQQVVTAGPPVYYHYENQRRGTSQQVFKLTGHAISGQGARSYIVRELEPDTDYYFRLAVRDGSGGYAASEVIGVRTKPLRTRFRTSSFTSALWGPPGTVVTLFFDETRAPLVQGEQVIRLGDKIVPHTIIDPYTATIVVPSYVQKRDPKYFVVESPSGLRDAPLLAFQVQ